MVWVSPGERQVNDLIRIVRILALAMVGHVRVNSAPSPQSDYLMPGFKDSRVAHVIKGLSQRPLGSSSNNKK